MTIKNVLEYLLVVVACVPLLAGSAMTEEFKELPPLAPDNETRLIDDDGFVAECLSAIFSGGEDRHKKVINFLITNSEKWGHILRIDFQTETDKKFANRVICWRGLNEGLRVLTAVRVRPLDEREGR